MNKTANIKNTSETTRKQYLEGNKSNRIRAWKTYHVKQ